MFKKILFPLWIVSAIFLFLYSFTQVDLSLTLSRASVFQTVEKLFQYVGWFNRPLSTVLFLLIILCLFGLYVYTLSLIKRENIQRKTVFKIIIFVSVILFFAYNAFSYDLFNYIFDAKIVTHYHLNPYQHKALDFPGDPMLSFMRWTHRTYPYGPAWLVISVPLSYLGFGYFLVTFYLFKLLSLFSFLGSVYLIEKIARKFNLNSTFAASAFALNPLVLIESLVSSHNDIVMMFFALFGVYLFFEKKIFGAALSLIISISIKFATAFLIPAFLFELITKKKKSIQFFYIALACMAVGVVAATVRTTFQPWYLLYMLPFAAFVQNKYFISVPVIIISFFSLLQYMPYIYLGNWDPPVPLILNSLLIGSILISAVIIISRRGLNKVN